MVSITSYPALGLLAPYLERACIRPLHALGIEGAADDVVTDTGQVLDTAAADHNDGVLLQVVADTGDVSGNFVAVGQTDTGDLTQSGVRLLRGGGTDCGADASLLGRRLDRSRGSSECSGPSAWQERWTCRSTCSLPFRTSWLNVGMIFLLSSKKCSRAGVRPHVF